MGGLLKYGSLDVLLCLVAGIFVSVGLWLERDNISGVSYNADNIKQVADPDNFKPFSFLNAIENWVATHAVIPFCIKLVLVSNPYVAILWICFWESLECFGYLSLINYFQTSGFTYASVLGTWFREHPGDSNIGDIVMGLTGIFVATRILKRYPAFNSSCLIRLRWDTSLVLYVSLFVVLCLSNVLSIITVVLKEIVEIPDWINGSLTQEFKQINYISIGHIYYILIHIVVWSSMMRVDLRWSSRKNVLPISEETIDNLSLHTEAIVPVYYWGVVYSCTVWCSTYFLLVRTYWAVLMASVFFLCLFEIWALSFRPDVDIVEAALPETPNKLRVPLSEGYSPVSYHKIRRVCSSLQAS